MQDWNRIRTLGVPEELIIIAFHEPKFQLHKPIGCSGNC